MYNILVCDDDRDIVTALKIYLEAEGYGVCCAYNGREAAEMAANNDVKLVLMDIMMPDTDGITAMRRIREFSNIPVILLTAKGEDSDKVLGLNVGADDYITKPFNPLEVIARVRSQLRRYTMLGGTAAAADEYRIGRISLNDRCKEVRADGEQVSLTPTEYEILKMLMESPGTVFSPGDIYRRVWKCDPMGCESTVAVHIRHLREKIEINPADPQYIRAIWGQGYRMESETK